jgi:hypothetical protein
MKKLFLLFSLFSFLFSLNQVRAYTQTDADNATYLSGKGIITSQSTTAGYRLDDTITRAEVAGIALKLRGVTLPEWYTCKRYFWDTIRNDWICRAVELAADAGLVSRANMKFRPGDKITRAEVIAMLIGKDSWSTETLWRHNWASYYSITEWNQWQQDAFKKFINSIIWSSSINPLGDGTNISGKINPKTFFSPFWDSFKQIDITWVPNKLATRSEVFAFVKKMYDAKIMSGEVTVQ